MNIDEAKELVEPYFKMTELEILEKFAALSKDYVTFGEGDYFSLLIPGTRKDKALLVAHTDTVFQDSPKIKVGYKDGLFFSEARFRGLDEKNKLPRSGGLGIGADDRAGIALLWHLKDLGHSLLLTGCEESGCLGSMQIMSNPHHAALIQDHQFAVQFDRQGRNDLVFYSVGSEEFEKYAVEQTGYETKIGSYTDICVLCEEICGVNLSVGYKNEHSHNEVLNLRWWSKTADVATQWLSKNDLPRFTK